MTDMEQRNAARQFIDDWKDRGDEKQDMQSFWLSLLRKVYGVADPASFISFEVRVKLVIPALLTALSRIPAS